jgi:DNA-binding SARP family transcriptional activator
MRFRLLGPIEAWTGDHRVDLGPPRQRSVLAVLLLEPGQVVPVPRLVTALWGEAPPRTAVKNLQVYVHHLRKALAEVPAVGVRTVGAGYLIQVDPDQVDLFRFRRLVADARTAPDPEASALLSEALALWQGPALADAGGELLGNVATQLNEEHLAALEQRLEIELRLGRHAECVAELGRLVTAYPLREQLRALLMLALFRSGRQAEALATFRAGHALLTQELGIEPGARLRQLHERILRADPELAVPEAAPATAPAAPVGPTPAELPHDVGGFAGRGGELAELDALLATSADVAAVIATVDGLGGIGKTALVVHWAHRVRDRFPDGVLYLDLRAHHPHRPPLTSAEALGQLLRGLGTPAQDIPADEGERSRLYRTRLAQGRRLVVLDNAASAAQVRPLLAGAPSCLTVVISRVRLAGLVATEGAHRIGLRPLAPAEADALLAAVLGAERLSADTDASTRLAELCGRFPLALRIAAANLAASPGRQVAALVAELAGDQLAGLRVDGDEEIGVRAAFDLSYRALGAPARRLFCLLGTAPGMDFSGAATTALNGTDAGADLRELTVAHLVEEQTTDRYRMHDLLRVYAAERARQDLGTPERVAAGRRLLDWYLRQTRLASAQLNIPRLLVPPSAEEVPDEAFASKPPSETFASKPPSEAFASDAAAMTWLESERPNLVAAVVDAAEHDPQPAGWRLALELRGFFRLRRYVTDWTAVTGAGLHIAEQLGDGPAQAALHHSLGHASWSLGEYPDAIDHYKRTLSLGSETGWPEGESGALSALGSVYHEMGQHDEAIANYQEALRTGALTPALELITVGSLGLVYQSVGRLREAVDSFTRALDLSEQRGLSDMVATGLGNLGLSHLDLGDLDEARDYLTRALALYQQVGSRNGEANVRAGLAMLAAETGAYDEAAYQAALALRISRDIADRRIECDARTAAGVVAHRRGELAGAREKLLAAIEVAETVGYGRGMAPAVTELAAVELALGDLPAAASTGERALALAQRSGYRPVQAQALTVAARICVARGEYDAARRHGEAAVDICQELGLRLALARSLAALDEARRATDDPG